MCLLLSPVAAIAQPADGRLEVSAGAGIFGGAALGDADANIRANSVQQQSYRLFAAETRFARAALLEARVGYALSRRLALEARFGFDRPEMRAALSSDAEGAQQVTAVERIDQYVIDVGARVAIEEWRAWSIVPFASVGAGYLRQLHEGQTLVEQGRVYYAGGGLKRSLVVRPNGFVETLGVRADVRWYLLENGIGLDDGPRSHGAISGSVFVGF